MSAPSAAGRSALGLAAVPAGPHRLFTGRAFLGATETHRGTLTADVRPGNGDLAMVLHRIGDETPLPSAPQVLAVVMDDARIFSQATTTTTGAAGATVFFSIAVNTQLDLVLFQLPGNPVPNAIVTWGSTNTGVLAVGALRCVTDAAGHCGISAQVSASAAHGSTAAIIAQVSGMAERMTVTVP